MAADSVDRKLVRAGVKSEVEAALGEVAGRLKSRIGSAGLSDEEKGEAAERVLEYMRSSAIEYCDELKRRKERQHRIKPGAGAIG